MAKDACARVRRKWFRPTEIAATLGVSGERVRQWFRAGRLANVGGRWYACTGAELEQFMATRLNRQATDWADDTEGMAEGISPPHPSAIPIPRNPR